MSLWWRWGALLGLAPSLDFRIVAASKNTHAKTTTKKNRTLSTWRLRRSVFWPDCRCSETPPRLQPASPGPGGPWHRPGQPCALPPGLFCPNRRRWVLLGSWPWCRCKCLEVVPWRSRKMISSSSSPLSLDVYRCVKWSNAAVSVVMWRQTPFGLFRIALVVVPFLYVGTQISKNFAALLEEHDIFVPEDDDDDDWSGEGCEGPPGCQVSPVWNVHSRVPLLDVRASEGLEFGL